MQNFINKLGMLRWLWITIVFFIVDQITKHWAEASLNKYEAVPVLPNLNLYLAYNEGAAFSFLSDAGGWQRWFFMLVAIVASAALLYWMKTLKANEKGNAIGLAFILSGAIGNLTDRVLFGHVIDFIQYFYMTDAQQCLPGFAYRRLLNDGECLWPAFNIADSAITVGAVLLISFAIRDALHERKQKKSSVTSDTGTGP